VRRFPLVLGAGLSLNFVANNFDRKKTESVMGCAQRLSVSSSKQLESGGNAESFIYCLCRRIIWFTNTGININVRVS